MAETTTREVMTKAKVNRVQVKVEVFNIPFNRQGYIGTGPQYCHLWESNPYKSDGL